ncbi:MAG TPA: type II toxin-antitoxin system HicB family antitoxin [Chloroflexota bacterium]|nr:type II toxin-antitoxin system HicB family antitoxin [Chloroflexota bacterium]
MRRYRIVLTPDPVEGGYTVRVPALPGCNTQGDSMAEAIANAREAIEGYLESLKELGRPIPEEHEPPTCVIVEVAA